MDLISRKSVAEKMARRRDYVGRPSDPDCIIADEPSVPAVPLDKLCEFLADTLHTPAPCFNNEEICPRMDFGYCRLPDALDVKECWKKILTKWMEGLDDAEIMVQKT